MRLKTSLVIQAKYASCPDQVSLPQFIKLALSVWFPKLLLAESTGWGSNDNFKTIRSMKTIHPDIALWEKVNAVYSEFFGAHKPVRCIVPAGPLHYGCLIEAEVIAART